MKIYIAGGHGKIALLLSQLLAAEGHEPVGIIRNPDQSADLEAAGATPLVLDLEATAQADVATAIANADAVVFAAGSGPGSTAERKLTVDRDGAILLADAAVAAGVRRYVLVSSMGADDFEAASDDTFKVYLRAKSEADAHVRESTLDYTIVRPGSLTDDAPSGTVTVGDTVARGSISRADVAAVLAHVLTTPAKVGEQFELISGDSAIDSLV